MAAADPKNPPNVPEGWVAKFDEKYKTFYYVNIATKKSQWEAPQDAGAAPPGAPPTYAEIKSKVTEGTSQRPNHSDNRNYQQQQQYQPQQQYYQQGPQQGYGGYPQQGYGGYPQQGFGGYPQQGFGGYPPQQQYYKKQSRFGGGGMGGGMMPGMMMGAGAGVLGAMALDSYGDHEYQEGFEAGGGGDDYGGGDFGGGDFGGGDF